MIKSIRRWILLLCLCPSLANAQEPTREDSWLLERDSSTQAVRMTRELTLTPKASPAPALRYRFLPDDFDLQEGNAMIYYLKALGFLEQSAARQKLTELYQKASDDAKEQEKPIHLVPPYSYLTTAPKDLPIQEVKSYLALTSFQPPMLEQARRLRSANSDRHIRDQSNPIAYLLPEIQSMRDLARTQSVRCRLAIAESRIDDAIQILGQQIAMAHHLGQDDFLVSNLVGVAIFSIAWSDACHLLEHPDAPNLYWAFASLPSPVVSTERSSGFERQLLYEQIKCLREVDESPKPPEYWQTFLRKFASQAANLDIPGLPVHDRDDDDSRYLHAVQFVASAYPNAMSYLVDIEGMKEETIREWPTTQVVIVAAKRYYERVRDEYFKWDYVPLALAREGMLTEESSLAALKNKVGLAGGPAEIFLPAKNAMRAALGRMQQTVALIQTVESIRMYAAKHDGKLPPSLQVTPVPAPHDPVTGQPFSYELRGNTAVLEGAAASTIRYRFVLRMK